MGAAPIVPAILPPARMSARTLMVGKRMSITVDSVKLRGHRPPDFGGVPVRIPVRFLGRDPDNGMGPVPGHERSGAARRAPGPFHGPRVLRLSSSAQRRRSRRASGKGLPSEGDHDHLADVIRIFWMSLYGRGIDGAPLEYHHCHCGIWREDQDLLLPEQPQLLFFGETSSCRPTRGQNGQGE